MSSPTPCSHLRPGVPIIRRDADTVHFGDSEIAHQLTRSEADWLRALPSNEDWEHVRRTCPTGTRRADSIIRMAHDSGSLQGSRECWWLSPAQRDRMKCHTLALSAWHPEPETAVAARSAHRICALGHPEAVSAMSSCLIASGLTYAEPQSADIAIIVSHNHPDSLEPHPAYESMVHLPVVMYRSRVTVGPLIDPGRTPCCQCITLHQRDANTAWTHVSAEWLAYAKTVLANTSVDPLLLHVAAASATVMVRHWIDSPQLPAPRRVSFELPLATPRSAPARFHPSCGCRWQVEHPFT